MHGDRSLPTSVQRQFALHVDRACVHLFDAADRTDHRSLVTSDDEVLQRRAAPSVGQVSHVEDHHLEALLGRRWDDPGPVRDEDPAKPELLQPCRVEVVARNDVVEGAARSTSETFED